MQTCEVGIASGKYEAKFFGEVQTHCPIAINCPYNNGSSFEFDGYEYHLCKTHGLIENIEKSALVSVIQKELIIA